MCLAFYVDPLLVATIVFPILFLVCILASLYFQERTSAFKTSSFASLSSLAAFRKTAETVNV